MEAVFPPEFSRTGTVRFRVFPDTGKKTETFISCRITIGISQYPSGIDRKQEHIRRSTTHPRLFLALHRDFPPISLDFTKISPSISLGFHWDFTRISLEFHRGFHCNFTGISLEFHRGFHWDFTGISPGFHRGFHWDCTGISSGFHRGFHWDFKKILGVLV